eukprot:SAG22_NODE_2815_length_2184_cov_2.473861_2_plen_60_part_00
MAADGSRPQPQPGQDGWIETAPAAPLVNDGDLVRLIWLGAVLLVFTLWHRLSQPRANRD